jgi:hypothetical protein
MNPDNPNQFYETPAYYVEQLLQDIRPAGRIMEPCVGDGAISRFLQADSLNHVMTNDIDPRRAADFRFDAAKPWPPVLDFDLDWVVTNPPFSLALPILQQALEHASAVALLLRISFFEPTKDGIRKGVKVWGRERFLVEHPPMGLIYLPRYSFTGNGKSDSSTVCWGIWGDAAHLGRPQWIRIAPRFPESES